MQKIKVYHFHNGSGGGVLSVIRNLLQSSNNVEIENHVIYTINKKLLKTYTINNLKGAASETIFYYSPNWNFQFTCKQLAKLLPDDKAIIIAHDWVELGMASTLGIQNKVIQFLHGDYDYYYDLAKLHGKAVDAFIAIADSIKEQLLFRMPERIEAIHYLRFPVPDSNCKINIEKENAVVFIGRCTNDKGFHLLPEIANCLQQQGIKLQWHIVGEVEKNGLTDFHWNADVDVYFHGSIANEKVRDLLCKSKYFILPSIAEGMPIALIESMKAGAVPLVNDLPGGIQELVFNNKTGFKIDNNNPAEFVAKLKFLILNNNSFLEMSNNCIEQSNNLFNQFVNTELIENTIKEISLNKSQLKRSYKVYGSKLDQQWIPNAITSFIRSFKK